MFEWATTFIDKSGYLGVTFGMFLENIFPPIPSELVMIFSGASAATGDMNIFLVILAGSIGSTLGLLPWYYAGKWYGKERLKRFAEAHGRFLTISGDDIEAADAWFDNHGRKTVFFGRFLPAVRTFVAIPAAIMEMKLRTFLIFAFLGALVWDGIFGGLGYMVGENSDGILWYVDLVTYILIGLAILWYIYRVITFRKK